MFRDRRSDRDHRDRDRRDDRDRERERERERDKGTHAPLWPTAGTERGGGGRGDGGGGGKGGRLPPNARHCLFFHTTICKNGDACPFIHDKNHTLSAEDYPANFRR